MDTRPNHTSPRSTASRLRAGTSVLRLVLVLAAGPALLGLALAVSLSLSADAAASPTSAASQPGLPPPVSNLQPFDHVLQQAPRHAQDTAQDRLPTSNLQPPSLPSAEFILTEEGLRTSLLATVLNGGFEDGNFNDWVGPGGSAAHAEVLMATNFAASVGPVPAPTEGNYFALLCTGPDEVSSASQGNIDLDPFLTDEYDTTILTKTIHLTAGDVPATLRFDWSFLTAEAPNAPDPYDDFFQVTLNGTLILVGSRQIGGVSPYPDVATNGVDYDVTSGGSTNGCSFDWGRNNFQTFRTLITNDGTYNLVFLVADQGDTYDDSGLLIDNLQVTPEIDLEITKTATPGPAIAGEPLIYEVTVINHGSGRAEGVVVTDTLPATVDFITDTLPTYTDPTLPQGCTFSSGQLFCDLGDVLGGESVSFEIEVDVDSDALANGTLALVNTAEVDSLTADGNLTNNTKILETILQDSADLRVTKVSKPDTHVRAGDIFTYTIFVDNLGPSHARNVVLTDTILSSGAFTLLSVADDPNRTSDSCTINGTIITCALGQSLEPQGDPPRNGRWMITIWVQANEAQDVNNEVLVFSADPDGPGGPQTATPDPDTSNNRATDFIAVTAVADLKMTKLGEDNANPGVGDFTVRAGERVRWTIVVWNDGGPSTAENVAVVDILPRGLVEGSVTVIAQTPAPGGGQCVVGTPGDPNEPLICQLGNLAPGDVATVTIRADVDPSYVVDQPNTGFANYVPNDAYLTSDTFDPETQNNIVYDALVEITAEAELEVQKRDRPDYVIAGEQLEYTLTISNGGPSTAEDVVLLDELPDEVIALYVNVVNEPHATCSIRTTPANIVDCGFGNILPGKVISMVVTSLVKANTPAGTITNTAMVFSLTSDPGPVEGEDPNPNLVEEETDVETEADVEITKVGEPVKVPAGEQVKYTIWVKNNGSSDAQDVVVFDLLPDWVVYEIDTNSPMCTRPGNLVGFRAELTRTVATEAAGLATFVLITNTNELLYAVEVTDIDNITGTLLTDGGANEVALFSGPPPVFDPTHPWVGSVTLTDAQEAALLANPASFQVIVKTSDFPAGEISGPIEQPVTTMTEEENIPLHCPIGTLAAGATHQFDIWALVDPATPAGTILTNVGIVTSTTTLGDPNMSNNVASANNFVEGEADLDIRKFGKPDGKVRAGEILTYTLIVDNLGPSAATGVAVKDILQSSDVFDLLDISSDRDVICVILPPSPAISLTVPISATTWPPTSTVEPPLVADISERVEIDCTLTGGLEVLDADGPPNAGRWLLTIRVRGDETQDINNVATVLSEQPDPNLDNNQAFVEHDITDVADLEVTKTAQGWVVVGCSSMALQDDQVTAGLSLIYSLVITNYGPSTAENVVLQDRLPPWIVVTGVTCSQGTCATGTPGEPLDKLICGLGTLVPGARATITINADVPSWVPGDTILENDAFVYSDIFDDTNANNFAHNLTTVSAWADLSVSKSDNPTTVIAGEFLEYTVTITNWGPSDALEVIAVDTLDPNVTFQSIRDPYDIGVVCSLNPIDEHTLTCAVVDNMPVGDVLQFTILVLVNPDAPSVLNNTISVSSDTDDQCGPNDDTEDTGVDRAQQLFVVKSDSPDPVLAGTELKYTITFGNNGPSEASNVVVTDTLPLGVLFDHCESLDPNDRVTCSVIRGNQITTSDIVLVEEIRQGNTVVYTRTGTLDVGEHYTFLVIADVEPGYVLNGRGDTNPGELCESFFQAARYRYFAHNRAEISADLLEGDVVVGHAEDRDDECTRVNAEADLELTKTDTPGPDYVYDPVSNSFVFDYAITVRNNGPSASAVVFFTDTLPTDVEFISWTIPSDMHCIFRDDGTVFCLVGNEPDNMGVNEPGRLNPVPPGTPINFVITVRVDAGSSPRTLLNRAEVQAVSENEADVRFPGLNVPGFYPDDATPTPDPDLGNNIRVETTTVFNARIRVDKKVLVGNTSGLSDAEIWAKCETEAVDNFLLLPDTQVTYCYFIYNEGDTWLNEVELTDPASGHVETASGPFVNIIGRVGSGSEFNATHALWAGVEGELAPMAPAGQVHPDGYTYFLATRTVTVDFPAGTFRLDDAPTILGSNTATVTAVATTKYCTTYPGVIPARDTDLLHDTLALPVLEKTDPEWSIYEDRSGDGLPSPRDVIEYVADAPNSGIIEATGVEYYDGLYNYIADDVENERVPGRLINGSVSAAIHVYGRDPVTGRVIDADVQPPDLAFGQDLLLRTLAPGIVPTYLEITYTSAIVLDEEILKGNNPGDDEVHVATRLPLPPEGWLLRFDGVTYDPPIPVIFSLRVRYQVRLKETKYVRLNTIVLNHGWVSYNEIGLFDQRFPNFDPAHPDAHTAANRVANNHAGTPGRAWVSPEFPGWPEIPVDVEPTDYSGLRFDDYALPGAPIRDDDDPTWFKLARDPLRIQVPVIEHEDDWQTEIKVQNGGDENTGVVVFFWGDYSGQCPYRDPGPVDYACKWVAQNGVWSLKAQVIPSTAKSAIVYSVDEDLFDPACLAAAYVVNDPVSSFRWREWEDDYSGTGEPIAVIVQRQGPNDHNTVVTSAYPGITENMEGGGPPYKYFAPYAMRQYHNLDTEIMIHNSGQKCTEVWLDYQQQDDCEFSYEEQIVQLAPGESIRTRVPEVLGTDWLGSIYVESDEPLGIVLDQTSFLPSGDQGTLLTYEARPYKLTTDTVFYADLVWRELSGWHSSIQVQNLTQHSQPTFVTVEFFDQSGNSIFYLGDWVCLHGGTTFYLPAITDLGMQYAGAAVIQSHAQIDYPGGDHDGQPIFAVVDLKKTKVYDSKLPGWRYTIPGEIQGGAYNALAESDKKEASAIMLPFLTKGWDDRGVTSLIAVRNNSNCNHLGLRLELRKGTGTAVTYLTDFWLSPGHIRLIDLANVGSVSPGFVGAGIVTVTGVNQLCDMNGDGYKDLSPTMPSVIVVNRGADPGDTTAVYEGIPFDYDGSSCLVTVSGQVIDELTLKPIKAADVNGHLTDSLGYYEFSVASSTWGTAFTLDVTKPGYYAWSRVHTLYCDDLMINPELDPVCKTITVTGTVEDKETGLPIAGADVHAGNKRGSGTPAVTDEGGNYAISDVPFDPDSVTIVVVSKAGYNPVMDTVYIPVCGGETQITFQLHQTPKSRILLYYGNGGEAAAPELGLNDSPHEYYNAEDVMEYFGYLVDYTASWPTDPDLEEYKVIFLLGPGNDSAPQDPAFNDFTSGQLAQLDLFLRNGGRLVVMTDANDAVTVENNLVNALNDLDLAFNLGSITGALADDLRPAAEQLLGVPTRDVSALNFDTAISLTVGAPADPGYVARVDAPHPDAGDIICGADTMPGITRLMGSTFAGDVVLVGDLNWMDDFSWMGTVIYSPFYIWPDWPADNENLLLNLIGF